MTLTDSAQSNGYWLPWLQFDGYFIGSLMDTVGLKPPPVLIPVNMVSSGNFTHILVPSEESGTRKHPRSQPYTPAAFCLSAYTVNKSAPAHRHRPRAVRLARLHTLHGIHWAYITQVTAYYSVNVLVSYSKYLKNNSIFSMFTPLISSCSKM